MSCCLSFFSLSTHFFQISRWVVFDKETFAAFIEHKIECWKGAKTCNCCPICLVESFDSLSGSDLSYCVKITFIVVWLEDRLNLSSLFDHINRNKEDTSNSLCEYSTSQVGQERVFLEVFILQSVFLEKLIAAKVETSCWHRAKETDSKTSV